MSPITWTSDLAVGHTEIDAQHQWLVDTVNRLYYTLDDQHDRAFTITTINDLLTYAWSHFRTEEEVFRQIHFADAEEHVREHEGFTSQVVAFRTRFVTFQENIFAELLDYLSDWLTTHLRDSDSKYVPYLQDKP